MKKNGLPLCRAMASIVLMTFVGSGCGVITEGGDNSSHPLFKTLNFIRVNGLPQLSELVPELPSHFSRIEGVNTDGSGLPQMPSNFGAESLSASVADWKALLAEAQSLSAQGFSEARRVEALVHNFVRPVYDILGRNNIFQKASRGPSGISVEDILNGIAPSPSATESKPVTNIFDEFFQTQKFVVDMGSVEGFPSKLMFNSNDGAETLSVSGLFELDGEYATGFAVTMRLAALDDIDMTFALRPSLLGGFIKDWKSYVCSDDVISIALKRDIDGQNATVSALECPEAGNAISSLTLTQGNDDTLSITGSFARSYPEAEDGSLRSWLGARQGFVLQAAAPAELNQVAAAAAVLSESDFENPAQEMIDQFGVGELIAKFVREKFWAPRLDKAREDNAQTTFGIAPASAYSNIAWWSCFQSGFKSLVNVSSLCDDSPLDVEAMLASFQKIDDKIQSFSFPGVDLSGLRTTSANIVSVLTIRNSLYIGKDGSLGYRTTDDESLQNLDARRSQLGVAALDSLSWKEGLGLESLTDADLPRNSLSAIADGISSFLGAGCAQWKGEIDEEAGTETNARCF